MPAKTKLTKASKASKENIFVNNPPKKNTETKTFQVSKPPRKVLGDKTNSASDDNASILTSEKLPVKTVSIKKKVRERELKNTDATKRPQRARRVPTRYIENNVSINNLSSNKSCSPLVTTKNRSPVKKVPCVVLSPLTSNKIHDNSLVINRPRRISRLPSKFDENFTSPNKFNSVQPINASTPLVVKSKKANKVKAKKANGSGKLSSKLASQKKQTSNELISEKKSKENSGPFNNTSIDKSSNQPRITTFLKKKAADSNNNANNNILKPKRTVLKSPVNNSNKNSSKTENNERIKILHQDSSFRMLDNKKSLKRNSNKLDVYEFTFDPSEEPPPAKKKKKRNVVKKPKPKKVVTFKSNYEKNLAKALATLKNAVAPDPLNGKLKHDENAIDPVNNMQNDKNMEQLVITDNNLENSQNPPLNQEVVINGDVEKNYNSVRVEDIALDIQHCDSLNYSPVNTPNRPKTPIESTSGRNLSNVNDPLNLQDNLSFFDDQPVASSSMNQSLRHPLASPWRIEFGSLPIKWQANTYVKPNMTPALESSFIHFNSSKKKHVYTSIVPPTNDTITELVESPNLKQTSILSFIKEVVEKSANKKKRKSTPVKANSLFEDFTNTFNNKENTPTKETSKNSKSSITPNKSVLTENAVHNMNTSSEISMEDKEKETETENEKITNVNNKNMTYFGFDESEDQENVCPTKSRGRSLRARRQVLREINTLKGPSRPVLPVAAKTKPPQHSDEANKIDENMKSAAEPPVITEMPVAGNTEITSVGQSLFPEENEDSQSVHLFEDIEMIHHKKPNRKSYCKRKKVAFVQKTVIGSDNSDLENSEMSSDDDLDQSFKLPSIKPKRTVKKRVTKKQKLSKKEEKEVEAWAAGFNSMCEDVDGFDLVVE